MLVIKPPTPFCISPDINTNVFLAGTIDMGASEDWQSTIANRFEDIEELTLLNPRRDAWDSSWSQTLDNPHFVHQVMWELHGMKYSDIIFMYFHPDSKAPVSLLELGLGATSDKLLVCCPEGYWRKGNVDIVCSQYNIPQVNDFDTAVDTLRDRILLK